MSRSNDWDHEQLKRQMGARLRLARRRRHLHQVDLAAALGEYGLNFSQSAVGKVERGERNLSIHELAAFVDILAVPAEWVLKGGKIDIT
jgi:transcriptional regulator with XRE-family HTH domain